MKLRINQLFYDILKIVFIYFLVTCVMYNYLVWTCKLIIVVICIGVIRRNALLMEEINKYVVPQRA